MSPQSQDARDGWGGGDNMVNPDEELVAWKREWKLEWHNYDDITRAVDSQKYGKKIIMWQK